MLKHSSLRSEELFDHRQFVVRSQSSVESDILLDVREYSFERIRGVGNVEFGIFKVNKEMRKIPLHAVVGAPNSAMGVVPTPPAFINRSLLEKLSPLVVPEFEPVRELCFGDFRKESHECLEIPSRFELGTSSNVLRDDHGLVKLAHLRRNGKAL